MIIAVQVCRFFVAERIDVRKSIVVDWLTAHVYVVENMY